MDVMDYTYRWELIDMLKSARLADWLITQIGLNQRLFIDAAKLLELDEKEINRLSEEHEMTDEERDEIERLTKRIEELEARVEALGRM